VGSMDVLMILLSAALLALFVAAIWAMDRL
jgi:hypothetical protein